MTSAEPDSGAAAGPRLHAIGAGEDVDALVEQLTRRARDREEGVHVVVHVTSTGGNRAFARVVAAGSDGDGVQRWLHHARRGASPGGWSEQHHPRGEVQVGAWKDAHAANLDRFLIRCSKRAWALKGEVPYVVEFSAVGLDEIVDA